MMLNRTQVRDLKLAQINRIHFVGCVKPFNEFCITKLQAEGKHITASEYLLNDPNRKKYEDLGILYPGGHSADYITEDIELIIYPNGPIPGNPECEKAEKLGIPAITIGQLTGLITRNLKTIAIAGTHGKTTTSAAIVWMLTQIDQEPNFIVGDKVLGLDKEFNVNPKSQYFVVEACEYKKQFLDRAPNPYISVITHIELDHTDFYSSQAEYNSAFAEFLSNTQETIIMNLSAQNERDVQNSISKHVKWCNTSEFQDQISNIKTSLPGQHNQQNLLRAYCCGISLGYAPDKISNALSSFKGVRARFELVGYTSKESPIYNDYAHNPAKIAALLEGAHEKYPDKQIILVFQPHSYERTYTFQKEFAKAVKTADSIIIHDIFAPLREQEEWKDKINAESFSQFLARENPDKKVYYTGDFVKTATKIRELDTDNEVFLLASAGDLEQVVKDIILPK